MADEDFDIQIVGLPEISETLDYLPIKLHNMILRETMLDAADPIVEAAQALAPVAAEQSHKEGYPGELRDSIGTVLEMKPDKNYAVAHVGPLYEKSKYTAETRTHSPGVYGKFVEFGTVKMQAHPFMRPAFQSAKERALEAFANGIGSRMEKLVQAVASLSTKQLGSGE